MIKFELNSSNPSAALAFEFWLDDRCVYQTEHVCSAETVACAIPQDQAEHVLRWVLKNKQAEHTTINSTGDIIQDANLIVKNISFDDIKLTHELLELIVYQHDYNGTGPAVKEKFYGELGCNGQAQLTFSTPIHMWLLEHM